MTNSLRSTRVRASRCPSCRSRNRGAASSDGRTPRPGEVAVCTSCSVPLAYDDELRLRWPTPAEIELWRASFDVVAAIAAVTFTRAELQRRVGKG